jgi:hypothetical protein
LLTFESRFTFPEGGIDKPTYLARGSAILLERKHKQTGESIAGIVTSRHNAHPFATPFYYEQQWSWLQHLRPKHCTFHVSLIGLKGPVWELELDRQMLVPHPSLDLCLFKIPTSESKWFLDELNKLDSRAFTQTEPYLENDRAFPSYQNVDCIGYDYSQDTENDRIDANRFLVARGRITSKHTQLARRRKVDSSGSETVSMEEFQVEAEVKLPFGMCGGPVVLAHDPKLFLGMVEGIDNTNGMVHCIPASTVWSLFDEKSEVIDQ